MHKTNYQYISNTYNDGHPQICAQTYLQALAEGDIPYHDSWTKNGYNDALSATYDNIAKSTTTFFMPYTNVIITDGTIDVPLEIPTKFCEGVDLKINAISPDGATYGSVAMRGWIETA